MAKRFPVEILTTVEVTRMLGHAGRGLTACRNRAIIVMLWRAGLRCAEALALAPRDVDLIRGTVRVRRGKGAKARTAALDPMACDVVRRWRDQRRRQVEPLSGPLFCTLSGGPLQTAYLRQMLPRLAKRAGIEKRVHPHALRHTFTVELAREGVPLHVIQAALGHNNVATTSRYIAHLEPQELVDAIRARVWPGEGSPGTAARSPSPRSGGAPGEHMTRWHIQLACLAKTELPPDGPKGR